MKSNTKGKSAKVLRQPAAARAKHKSVALTATATPITQLKAIDGFSTNVALRAYQLWQQSGHAHGNDIEHWLVAEKQLLENVN